MQFRSAVWNPSKSGNRSRQEILSMKITCFGRLVVAVSNRVAATATTAALAAEKQAQLKPAEFQTVEMFAAIKSGDIKVEFIPKDTNGATVIIRNNSDRPLSVILPEAFAGVPVLAQ